MSSPLDLPLTPTTETSGGDTSSEASQDVVDWKSFYKGRCSCRHAKDWHSAVTHHTNICGSISNYDRCSECRPRRGDALPENVANVQIIFDHKFPCYIDRDVDECVYEGGLNQEIVETLKERHTKLLNRYQHLLDDYLSYILQLVTKSKRMWIELSEFRPAIHWVAHSLKDMLKSATALEFYTCYARILSPDPKSSGAEYEDASNEIPGLRLEEIPVPKRSFLIDNEAFLTALPGKDDFHDLVRLADRAVCKELTRSLERLTCLAVDAWVASDFGTGKLLARKAQMWLQFNDMRAKLNSWIQLEELVIRYRLEPRLCLINDIGEDHVFVLTDGSEDVIRQLNMPEEEGEGNKEPESYEAAEASEEGESDEVMTDEDSAEDGRETNWRDTFPYDPCPKFWTPRFDEESDDDNEELVDFVSTLFNGDKKDKEKQDVSKGEAEGEPKVHDWVYGPPGHD